MGENMGNNKRNTEKQKQKTTVTETCITSNGVPCTDNTDIANNFNLQLSETHLQQTYHKQTTIQLT